MFHRLKGIMLIIKKGLKLRRQIIEDYILAIVLVMKFPPDPTNLGIQLVLVGYFVLGINLSKI